eukprot:g27517.t1
MRRSSVALWALLGLAATLRSGLLFVAPLSRRAQLSALLAPVLSSAAANAEDAPKPKKERPPEALIAEGYPAKAIPLNGRWSIVFGKKLNGKPVYKKDGEKHGPRRFEFKVRPETKDDLKSNLAYSQAKLDDLVNEEMAKMEKQQSVGTFRGTMADDDEAVGDRLMSKMGAKIIKGMLLNRYTHFIIDSFETALPKYTGLISRTPMNLLLFVLYIFSVLYFIFKICMVSLWMASGILCCLCCCGCRCLRKKAQVETKAKNGKTGKESKAAEKGKAATATNKAQAKPKK